MSEQSHHPRIVQEGKMLKIKVGAAWSILFHAVEDGVEIALQWNQKEPTQYTEMPKAELRALMKRLLG